MSIDVVWWEHPRDWRWLWLRRRSVECRRPATAHDISRMVTMLEPQNTAFLDLLLAEKDALLRPQEPL